MMIKPRKRDDVKEVLFYNGYWILDYGNGYYSAGKNIGYAPKESMLKRIDSVYKADQIKLDIQALEEKKAKAERAMLNYEIEINSKLKLLEQAENRQEETETEN